MSVLCHICGKESEDREFCDHCNADLVGEQAGLPPNLCPLTPDGIALSDEERHDLCFAESSMVVEAEGRQWRVHWLAADADDERGPLVERRLALQTPALPMGLLLEDAGGKWLAFESAPSAALPWASPRGEDSLQEMESL